MWGHHARLRAVAPCKYPTRHIISYHNFSSQFYSRVLAKFTFPIILPYSTLLCLFYGMTLKIESSRRCMSHQFFTAPRAVSPPKMLPPAAKFSPSFSFCRTSSSSCIIGWFLAPLWKSFFANSSASLDIFKLSFRGGELCIARNLL